MADQHRGDAQLVGQLADEGIDAPRADRIERGGGSSKSGWIERHRAHVIESKSFECWKTSAHVLHAVDDEAVATHAQAPPRDPLSNYSAEVRVGQELSRPALTAV